MLEAYIIEEIKRLETEEFRRQNDRPRLEIPINFPESKPTTEKELPRVITIEV